MPYGGETVVRKKLSFISNVHFCLPDDPAENSQSVYWTFLRQPEISSLVITIMSLKFNVQN